MSTMFKSNARAIFSTFSAFLVLFASRVTADAANITPMSVSADIQPSRTNTSGVLTRNHIRITGPLIEGDSARLRAILTEMRAAGQQADSPVIVEFNSNGGDVYEGLNIGYLLREFEAASLVRKGDVCLSACALAFLGGTASNRPPVARPDRRVEIGGTVGFHNFFINPDSPGLPPAANPREGMIVGFDLATGGSALLVRYAAMMSIDTAFIARLLGRPSDMWDFVDRNFKFVDLASCPMMVERPGLKDAELAANVCNHAVGGLMEVDASKAHAFSARDARRRLLSFMQKNVAGLLSKGPLASQLSGALAGRDDRAVDALYEELRSVGVHLPDLVGTTFEVEGYVFGGYDLQCHVSLSATDPDRYEVAITSPAGLVGAFKAAPDKCKRLFLFDRSAMHNPPREF